MEFSYIVIEHAINVTLTGEYPCGSIIRDQCSTILLLEDSSNPIPIYNVTEFVMMDLRFSATEYSYTELTLEYIHNMKIRAVLD